MKPKIQVEDEERRRKAKAKKLPLCARLFPCCSAPSFSVDNYE